MDKDYSKVYLFIFLCLVISASVFGVKDLIHKRELNKLLQVTSVDYRYINPKEQNKVKLSKIHNKDLDTEEAKAFSSDEEISNISTSDNSSKKIANSSSNVEKKSETGIDLISNNESMESKQDAEFDVDGTSLNNNSDNIQLLARLIQSEAGDEPYMGKLAVGNVVLYRVNQDNVSIKDTIFKKGQFDGVNTSNFNIQPSEDSMQAAKEVLNGRQVLTDGYYFVNLKMASPSWAQSNNFIKRIGDHWFFRKEQ
ncbi:cell wall hydrolase (plasmid) [Clostridium beijerinckii]|uniref:cell wall hydrolase n=1 Tax=Clostridium beijerinckii TaxID=1520 RepID=UPI002227A4E4|nr:cell wall hydrolase [Clostridium beijerinckii]UYZ39107.1 cell wall hydrolase [Clostridium beijerinckii]